jgi:UPF0271 protein
MQSIDLNADVGEGFGSDLELIRLVTSANVACGFHAGDAATMAACCAAARDAGVAVGAHVSYRDREGFGRRELPTTAATIESETREQIDALVAAGGDVRFVKPHGALYHRATTDDACARAIVAAAAERALGVLGFPGSSLLARAREAGLVAVAEGFADRGYAPDGTLLPRGEEGAVLDADGAARQAVALADHVDSICVHGDTPGAAGVARRVRDALESAGVDVRAFV